ncbi:unnamed protein product [Acanthoscelides obtectus]|uniref:G-protein coupled receptors family 1 profile domain-containing protein n=1 Tax=Acanthoscelides obtectus TaxID=200917 RepID=A0A9P0JP21_ACAOB|nr:unnamed protein product [Acanthoscelides obtectus]CAK1658019.1 Glucose-dependent insulinotropic receptor [Acanthoscelides obtectus]
MTNTWHRRSVMHVPLENASDTDWCACFDELWRFSQTLYHYVIPFICVAIIPLNLSVVISCAFILKRGKQPTCTYLFMGNMALSDLLTGISLLFDQLFPYAHQNHYICELKIGMYATSMMTSVYSLGLIGIDRFIYIVHGLQYQRLIYPFRAKILIMMTWFIGGTIGFLPLMGWHNTNVESKPCWYINTVPKELIILTTVLGVIPLLTVLVLYSIILHHALKKICEVQSSWLFRGLPVNEAKSGSSCKKQSKDVPNHHNDNKLFLLSPLEYPRCSKAIRVVLFTTGCFVVTWFPYLIACLIYVSECDLEKGSRLCMTLKMAISSPLALLGSLNSVLNPLIYAWWHKGFRGYVKENVKKTLVKKISTISLTHSDSSSN